MREGSSVSLWDYISQVVMVIAMWSRLRPSSKSEWCWLMKIVEVRDERTFERHFHLSSPRPTSRKVGMKMRRLNELEVHKVRGTKSSKVPQGIFCSFLLLETEQRASASFPSFFPFLFFSSPFPIFATLSLLKPWITSRILLRLTLSFPFCILFRRDRRKEPSLTRFPIDIFDRCLLSPSISPNVL